MVRRPSHLEDAERPGTDVAPIFLTVRDTQLGHALGCCAGAGTDAGHWTDCTTELMCKSHSKKNDVFSDRELAQMGLGN